MINTLSKRDRQRPINRPLTVGIEGNEVVIRIGINTLKFVTEYCPRFYDGYKDPANDGPYVTVEDKRELGKDICAALQHEEEDGTTPLYILFDDAIEYAYGDGSLAFKYDDK